MRLKTSKAEKVAYLRFHAFYAFCAFAWLRFCTFVLLCFLCVWNLFVKKIKIKKISNRPNDLIYITTDIDSISRQIQDPCNM